MGVVAALVAAVVLGGSCDAVQQLPALAGAVATAGPYASTAVALAPTLVAAAETAAPALQATAAAAGPTVTALATSVANLSPGNGFEDPLGQLKALTSGDVSVQQVPPDAPMGQAIALVIVARDASRTFGGSDDAVKRGTLTAVATALANVYPNASIDLVVLGPDDVREGEAQAAPGSTPNVQLP